MNSRKMCVAGWAIAASTAMGSLALATPIIGVPATSVPTPQPLGTSVTITASATDTDPGVISYRYQIGAAGSSALSLARDFSVDNTFVYTPTRQEGNYQFVVSARNNSTGAIATSSVPFFRFTPLVVNGAPVITPTANPLVALFSSPPCASGGTYTRASVLKAGSPLPFYTNWVACSPGQNLNFIIAGMSVATQYTINSQTTNGSTLTPGPKLTFTTGTPTVSIPATEVLVPQTSQDDQTQRFILFSTLAPFPFATDLGGRPLWYYVDPSGSPPLITRPLLGGDILMIAPGANSAGTSVKNSQILRQIDLAGNIIRETNATRISEQVTALSGIVSSCVVGGTDCVFGGFSHDAVRLPNGHTLALGDEERIFTDGTQGSSPANPVDIVGDIFVDLDANWQVVGYWRAFDHLNANRAAILGETCVNNQGGCPPILLTNSLAQDWLHGNALQYSPADGSVLYSTRHQDWILKIDYGNGKGTYDTIWTLGKDGDFQINSSDPYPWFSHQHDPGFVQNGTSTLAVFDNGNTRVSPPPLGLGYGDSRGYVLSVDQTNKMATPILLADLGFFSTALGTAELLSNGNYHFEAGYPVVTPPYSQSIEVLPSSAALSYILEIPNVLCYRSFQMVSLYEPPDKD